MKNKMKLNIQMFAENDGVGEFNAKYFNKKAFGAYYDTIPQERLNLLLKSGVLRRNPRLKQVLSSQTGSEYAIIPMTGRLNGKPVNYDGKTKYDKGKTLPTYKQGVIAIGRKDKFYEDYFTYDITAGKDFMSQVAEQTSDYWDTAWENILMIIIKAMFAITTKAGLEFAIKHTYDITSENVKVIDETTQNTALQRACGDRRKKFSLSIVHSMIATNLENKKLLSNFKYNDANGIERELNMYSWNGKILIEYDDITYEIVDAVYAKTADTELDASKTYYEKSGDNYIEVEVLDEADISNYYEQTDPGKINYITYVLGNGAIDYEDLGAKNPHTMREDDEDDRTYLYQRQRKTFMPHGVSYLMKNQITDSPTDEELADGVNWDIVMGSDGKPYNHREIAVARIISRG